MSPPASASHAFARAGALREEYAATDWAAGPLGDPQGWSPALRASLDLIWGTRFAATLLWGPELVLLYNEAYVELMGDKHPALGRRCDEVFPEAMDAIGPLLAQVRAGGEATWSQDVLLPLERAGYVAAGLEWPSYRALWRHASSRPADTTPG